MNIDQKIALMTAPTPAAQVVTKKVIEYWVIYIDGKYYRSFKTRRGCLNSFTRLAKKVGYEYSKIEWELIEMIDQQPKFDWCAS